MSSYADVKRELAQARIFIMAGRPSQANDLISHISGASAHDIAENLGPAALRVMREWIKAGRPEDPDPTDG